MLYVVELINGEKHFFAKETDRNYYLNSLTTYLHLTAKTYEKNLQEIEKAA